MMLVCSGYMSPEYAMHGQFSVKSDVYSFGVLILEILSGKKISAFGQSDTAEDLLSYVSGSHIPELIFCYYFLYIKSQRERKLIF